MAKEKERLTVTPATITSAFAFELQWSWCKFSWAVWKNCSFHFSQHFSPEKG